jgi:hypothetical protein
LFRQNGSPYYTLRVMYLGRRRTFSTGETSMAAATRKAKVILADVRSRGFEAAIQMHAKAKPRDLENPPIAEFCDLYQEVADLMEAPPSVQTRARYVSHLQRICRAVHVSRIRQLTPERVESFRATVSRRNRPAAPITVNTIIRNAAAIFSKEAMRAYSRRGLNLENPFAGLRHRRVRLKPYTPLRRDVLSTVWTNGLRLLDGDKNFNPDGAPAGIPDLRQPQPGMFALLLLELGLGLRRNEADKAEWSWVIERSEQDILLSIRETPYFRPKSKEARLVPVQSEIHELLLKVKRPKDPFIVPGAEPRIYGAGDEPKHLCYRCNGTHRALAAWLRWQGVNDPKPCHLLRKEFGSLVATQFGLFHAQKLLGHSTPVVTAAFYAGLTSLPDVRMLDRHGD